MIRLVELKNSCFPQLVPTIDICAPCEQNFGVLDLRLVIDET